MAVKNELTQKNSVEFNTKTTLDYRRGPEGPLASCSSIKEETPFGDSKYRFECPLEVCIKSYQALINFMKGFF